MFGHCPFKALTRKHRRNKIRTVIENAYRKENNLDVYKEVIALANEGSIRRMNIMVFNRRRN